MSAGSSWYLLCEICREKYVKTNRGGKQLNAKNLKSALMYHRKSVLIKPLASPSTSPGLEPHIIMKNNAIFLLDLASSAESSVLAAHQRRSSASMIMPSVSENNSPPDYSGPFSPIPPFQCLQALDAHLVLDDSPSSFYEAMLHKQNLHDGLNGSSTNSQRVINNNK